jgi:hypothetical protein
MISFVKLSFVFSRSELRQRVALAGRKLLYIFELSPDD